VLDIEPGGTGVAEERERAMAAIGKYLDKAYEGKEFSELVDAPVSALQGVSEADAEALSKALGIKTIGDLASSKYVRWAQAIAGLSS
jgi:hypothetical protein